MTHVPHRLTRWIAAFELLLTFALADAAIVIRSAHLLNDTQLLACAVAYVLIVFGTLVTAWQME